MKGLDKEKALEELTAGLALQFEGVHERAELAKIAGSIYEADEAYMLENHILDEDGMEGDAYYDDDEAFEYIMDALTEAYGLTEETEMPYAEILDRYMEIWEELLEREGLISWDGE